MPLIEGVFRAEAYNAPHFAISNSGTLVYMPLTADAVAAGGGGAPRRTLVWVDRMGKEEPLAAASDGYGSLKISPDGAKVALSIGAV